MAQVYSSKDAGVPVLYASNTASLARFTNYKLILKACLVTGYGARPPAGWELIDEGDMYLVLRNADGNYVSITSGYYVNSSNLAFHGVFKVWLHASYTGMSAGGVPQGVGAITGKAAGNSIPHWFGTDLFSWSATGTRWTVVADARTAIFTIQGYTSAASGVTGAGIEAGPVGTLYLGADLGGNLIAAGGQAIAVSGTQPSLYFQAPEITTLRNPRTGLLVDAAGIPNTTLAGAASRTQGSDTVSESLQAGVNLATIVAIPALEMSQVRWVADGQAQAGLRGIRKDILLTRISAPQLRNSLEGNTTSYTGDTIHNLAPLADGYHYLPLLAAVGGRSSLIITDNPDYW
jgi:hypothetical protein